MRLELKNISAGYAGKTILQNISFTLENREILSFLGPNGCGKSTLLRTACGQLPVFSGEVLLDGVPLKSIAPLERARKIALLPQFNEAPQEMTVRELVAFGRYPYGRFLHTLSAHDRESVNNALNLVRLEKLRDRKVSTLSGGERQRAWIAMMFAREPQILMLDEPMSFLDIRSRFEIADTLVRMNREYGTAVLCILHDLNLASSVSSRIILMKDGRIYAQGKAEEVYSSENLRNVFGIESRLLDTGGEHPFCIATGTSK